MIREIAAGLDKADAMAPGAGRIDFGAIARPGYLGAHLTAHMRLNKYASAYAKAHAVWSGRSVEAAATIGARIQW